MKESDSGRLSVKTKDSVSSSIRKGRRSSWFGSETDASSAKLVRVMRKTKFSLLNNLNYSLLQTAVDN